MYIVEENEAVIKVIIKDRSPMVRHVSRTHGVPLDWFFDRVNLDPKIQIKYVGAKNQHADEPSLSSVQHHEFLDVFLQPFSSNEEKAEHNVEESSGKKDRRRACGDEIKAGECHIKKFERESISHLGFGYIIQLGEVQIGLEF